MPTGKVKFYDSEKGFGFIKNDETSEDVFVHRSGIIGSITDNDQVSFEVEEGRRGLNAVNVERIN